MNIKSNVGDKCTLNENEKQPEHCPIDSNEHL